MSVNQKRILNSKKSSIKTNKQTKFVLMMLLMLNISIYQTNAVGLLGNKKGNIEVTSITTESSGKFPIISSVEVTVQNDNDTPLKKTTEKKEKDKDKALDKDEIKKESRNSLVNCADIKVKNKYADCVIENLSLEFFFTGFLHYKKKFKKSYNSVTEEMKRFGVFMDNYQKILK